MEVFLPNNPLFATSTLRFCYIETRFIDGTGFKYGMTLVLWKTTFRYPGLSLHNWDQS
jgi:hypothetical protein